LRVSILSVRTTNSYTRYGVETDELKP